MARWPDDDVILYDGVCIFCSRWVRFVAQRDTANKSAEALKRQAEGLSTEYARLTREKAEKPFDARFGRWMPWDVHTDGTMSTYDHVTGRTFYRGTDGLFRDAKGDEVQCAYDANTFIEKSVNQRLLRCSITFMLPGGGGLALPDEPTYLTPDGREARKRQERVQPLQGAVDAPPPPPRENVEQRRLSLQGLF